VGPLHPDFEYEISASMEDYVMTPDEKRKGDFVAKKLSKLIFKASFVAVAVMFLTIRCS